MYAYCISVYVYSKYIISNYINKHTSKRQWYYKRPPFLCGAGGVVIYKCCDIAPALPRALFLYIAPLLALLAVLSALFLYIQRITDKARRVSAAVWRLVAFPPVSAFLSLLVGRHIHPTPPQKPARQNRAAFPKNFFWKYFFYFCICNRGLQASGSRFVFCWLFSCRMPKNRVFSWCWSCDWL